MNISGSGSLPGGDYNEDIRISGSGKVNGNAICDTMVVSGSGHVYGDLTCRGAMKVSGSGKVDGTLAASELHVSGSCHIGGPAQITDSIGISGSCHVGPVRCTELRVSGSLNAEGDVSAEDAEIKGKIECTGLINAGTLTVAFSGNCFADSIGGSVIEINMGRFGGGLISRFFMGERAFTVQNSIEGDKINLQHVIADTVVGRDVVIGPGCKIRRVVYGEHIDISPEASVEYYEPSRTA